MPALLLRIFLAFSFVAGGSYPDECDDLFAAANEAHEAINSEQPERIQAFLNLSRKARACEGDIPSERQKTTFYRELSALQQLGELRGALHLLDVFENRFASVPDSSMLWWLHGYRGYLNYYLNNLNEAARNYSQALHYSAHSTPLQHLAILLDLADTVQRLRDFSAARSYRIQANALLDTLDQASELWTKGRIRFFLGQADLLLEITHSDTPGVRDSMHKAIDLTQQGLVLLRDFPLDYRTVWAHMLFGDAFSNLSAFDTAESHYHQGIRLARQLGDDHWTYRMMEKLGRGYTKAGRLDKAEETLRSALSLMESAVHLDEERRTLNALGYLYELRDEPQRAEEYYERAIGVTEDYHESLRMTDWSAQALGEWKGAYRGMIRALLAQERFADAFLALERTRARHLQDLRIQSQLLGALPEEDRLRFDSLTAALSETQNRLASDTLDLQEHHALTLEKTRLVAERRTLLKLDTLSTPPPLDTLRQLLAEREQVIVSYFIDTEGHLPPRPARSYAFVLTPETLTAVPLLASEDTVRTLLAQVSPLLNTTDAAPDFDARHFSLEALNNLYDLLYAPIAPHLSPGERLVIIPDGPLFMLPFGMLVEENVPAYQYQEASFLIEKHPLAVELATALMLHTPSDETNPDYDIIAFGKADFSDIEQPGLVRTAPENGGRLINLPAVPDEIGAISRRFGSALTRLDADATEASFSALTATAQIIHLASHTLLRPGSPLYNAIVLSKDPTNDQYDGTLYLHEIEQRRLAAHLVVLSGCNTARGVLQPGEGMAGLQYAFRAMGVESSLATSWFVDDKTTGRLIDVFYGRLAKGLPKDVALQQAQLHYLHQAEDVLASPFFWAAPVLYGDAASLSLKAAFPLAILRIGIVLLLLPLLYLGFRYFRTRQAPTKAS